MVPALFVSDPGGCAFHATVAINVVIAVAKDGTAVDGLPSACKPNNAGSPFPVSTECPTRILAPSPTATKPRALLATTDRNSMTVVGA